MKVAMQTNSNPLIFFTIGEHWAAMIRAHFSNIGETPKIVNEYVLDEYPLHMSIAEIIKAASTSGIGFNPQIFFPYAEIDDDEVKIYLPTNCGLKFVKEKNIPESSNGAHGTYTLSAGRIIIHHFRGGEELLNTLKTVPNKDQPLAFMNIQQNMAIPEPSRK